MSDILARGGDSDLGITFQLRLSDLRLGSRRRLIFAPLVTKRSAVTLGPVVVGNGGRGVECLHGDDGLGGDRTIMIEHEGSARRRILFSRALPCEG